MYQILRSKRRYIRTSLRPALQLKRLLVIPGTSLVLDLVNASRNAVLLKETSVSKVHKKKLPKNLREVVESLGRPVDSDFNLSLAQLK